MLQNSIRITKIALNFDGDYGILCKKVTVDRIEKRGLPNVQGKETGASLGAAG